MPTISALRMSDTPQRESMKPAMFASVQVTVRTPASCVRSVEYAHTPSSGLRSSLAHWISHFCPDDVSEFLLTSAITPWDRRMRVRTLSFQPVSYGSFTD